MVMGAHVPLFLVLVATASALSSDAESDKNRPVTKVIKLLEDMQKTLEEEAKADQEVYDQFACWCETNDKEKTKAIADAEAKIDSLKITIEELTAESTRLGQEIKTLEEEVKKNQAALGKATAMRMKAQEEFSGEEKDLLQSVQALKSAIVVLSKHHPSALLQSDKKSSQAKWNQVTTLLQHEMEKHGELLKGVLTMSQRKVIQAFVQSPSDYFNDASDSSVSLALNAVKENNVPGYAPQSGQILGILKQMMETFESNLSQSQKDELQASSDYENLKAAKEHEIKSSLDQIETKTQELATTDEKLAEAKVDLEDTTNGLDADQKFLMNLKEQCATMDSEWEERSKTRAMEIEAVSKAMEFLSSDEAHDLFTRTFNMAFVQKSQSQKTVKSRERRDVAAKLLKAVARKTKNPKLMTLALSIRLDAFTKVKAAIDDMIAELTKEQSDEVKTKDYCIEALNKNERATEGKEREKKSLEGTVDDLTMTIGDLKEAIDTLKADIKEMQFQMKRAGEDRARRARPLPLEAVAHHLVLLLLLHQDGLGLVDGHAALRRGLVQLREGALHGGDTARHLHPAHLAPDVLRQLRRRDARALLQQQRQALLREHVQRIVGGARVLRLHLRHHLFGPGGVLPGLHADLLRGQLVHGRLVRPQHVRVRRDKVGDGNNVRLHGDCREQRDGF